MGKEHLSLEQEREYQRQLMAERNFIARDLKLPRIKYPKRRAICLEDPLRFMRTYFDWIFFNPFTVYQKEMCEAIRESIQYGTQNAIAGPRGEGKTSHALALEIHGLAKGEIKFPVILASTDTMADRVFQNAKEMLTCEKFVEDFPEIGYPLKMLKGEARSAKKQTVDGKSSNITWTKNLIQLPDIDGSPCAGGLIMPLSIEGTIRGINVNGRRPDHGLIDDPETRESASNIELVNKRLKIIESDFAGLKGPDNRFGMTALVTIMTGFSLAAKITDRKLKPAWGGIRRGLIETWPTNRHLWEEYFELRKACQERGDPFGWAATQFYIERFDEMNEGCKMANPYRFNRLLSPAGNPIEITSLQACMNFICDKSIDDFLTEYQSDTMAFGEDTQEKDDVLTARVVESRTNGYEKGTVPEESIGITCGLDIGRRFCHWWKTAWAPENRGFVIDYGVIEVHHYQAASIERTLRAALSDWQETQAASGSAPELTLLDTSDGTLTDALYDFVIECNEWPKIAACKGYGAGQGPRPTNFEPNAIQEETLSGNHWWAKQQAAKGIWLYHPDANFWKLWIQERFKSEPFDSLGNQNPNTITLYRPARVRIHQAIARHLTAEEYRYNKRTKRGEFIQVNSNNHWLDAGYMSCAAAEMLNLISSRETSALLQ